MPRLSAAGSFKYGVLHEVSQPLITGFVVAAANVDGHTRVLDGIVRHKTMDAPHAAGESEICDQFGIHCHDEITERMMPGPKRGASFSLQR